MPSNDFTKSAAFAAVLTVLFAAFWEFFWRDKGYPISYNDDKVIWAKNRKQVYLPTDQSTVFIGDSRVKFDIDLVTWKKLTGEDAIQLALVGTTPLPVLQNLANDPHFHGKVIMGGADAAFYSLDSIRRGKSARDGIEYFQTETPAQNLNASLDFLLESNFVFLEEGKFGLNALLNTLPLHNRKGVFVATGPPKGFAVSGFNRQSSISPMLFKDTGLKNSVIRYWTFSAAGNYSPPIKGDTLEIFFKTIKKYIDQIRAKGGDVVMVRPPSGGSVLAREKKSYPKDLYWDRLLQQTETAGFFYTDYPETAGMYCPEESHLSPENAALFTKALVHFLHDKKEWNFPDPYDSAKHLMSP